MILPYRSLWLMVGLGSLVLATSCFAEPELTVTPRKVPQGLDDGLKETPLRQNVVFRPVADANARVEIILVEGAERRSVVTVPVVNGEIRFGLQLPSADFNRLQVDYKTTEKGFSSVAQPIKKSVVEKSFVPNPRLTTNTDLPLAVMKCADGSAIHLICRFGP